MKHALLAIGWIGTAITGLLELAKSNIALLAGVFAIGASAAAWQSWNKTKRLRALEILRVEQMICHNCPGNLEGDCPIPEQDRPTRCPKGRWA